MASRRGYQHGPFGLRLALYAREIRCGINEALVVWRMCHRIVQFAFALHESQNLLQIFRDRNARQAVARHSTNEPAFLLVACWHDERRTRLGA